MAREKGVLKFQPRKKEVIFYTTKEKTEYDTLDDFLYSAREAEVYMSFNELNTLNQYLDSNINKDYNYKLMYNSPKIKKRIGIGLYKNTKRDAVKSFYDMKYKIGSDSLDIEIALEKINEERTWNAGYTSYLRRTIKTDENICFDTVNNPPSMTPLIYSSPLVEYRNVKCYDSCSFYPYLLTQPLPRYKGKVNFETEEIFNDKDYTYYGSIVIKNLKAKKPYYPLTLVGKNYKGITIQSQGRGIVNRGKQLVSANLVKLNGFIPDLLFLLKQNYDFEVYEILPILLKFKLEIDETLRAIVLKFFEKKQEKKRNEIKYDGEKILLNRIYGFFITKGVVAPAHYSQYVVSQGRLILNNFFHKVGSKYMVHIHTDGFKCIGEHQDIVDEYNATIEFPELGKFELEDVFQKCVYYSHITGKYINKKGELKFKHGGIEEEGLKPLYRMNYEDIDDTTPFVSIQYWAYTDHGFCPFGIDTNFGTKINEGDDEDEKR